MLVMVDYSQTRKTELENDVLDVPAGCLISSTEGFENENIVSRDYEASASLTSRYFNFRKYELLNIRKI